MAAEISKEVRANIEALCYNGSVEELYASMHDMLKAGIKHADVSDVIISRLTTADMELLIQSEC